MNSIEQLKKYLVIGGVVIVGLMVAYMQWQKRAIREEVAEYSGGISPALAAEKRTEFNNAMAKATLGWRSGNYRGAAVELYHAYPAYESVVTHHGSRKTADGATYHEEFESARETFTAMARETYPAMLEKVKSGDMPIADMETVTSHLPFPFRRELERTWRDDRSEVERVRRAYARNWFLVFVSGVESTGIEHAGAIREALRRKWSHSARLKLVFDKPSGADRVAARYLHVDFEEKNVVYEFAKSQQHRGSGTVPEGVSVRFNTAVRPDTDFATTWDSIPPLEVKHVAPERLKFRFDNARQQADFDGVVAEQRAALTRVLADELAKALPAFEIK